MVGVLKYSTPSEVKELTINPKRVDPCLNIGQVRLDFAAVTSIPMDGWTLMNYDHKGSFLTHALSGVGTSQLTVKIITLTLRLTKKESIDLRYMCP